MASERRETVVAGHGIHKEQGDQSEFHRISVDVPRDDRRAASGCLPN